MADTKYIFVTGGVVSSLGKGIISASLGKLLQARGYKVTIQKFDPYINIDGHVTFPMFIRVQRTRVDVDVWVKLLDSNVVTSCLKKFTDGWRYDSFTQRRNHTTSYEDVLCFSHDIYNLN